MFHRILVAIDESDGREQVFEQALSLAKSMNAQMRVFHTLTTGEADYPKYPLAQTDVGFVLDQAIYDELLQRYAQERQAYEEHHLSLLRDIAEDAVAEGVPTDSCLAYGSPGKEICQMAEDWKADAIVIGRRGNLGLTELWLGSVSNYVVHHAPCSVLVIQGTAPTPVEPEIVTDFAHA